MFADLQTADIIIVEIQFNINCAHEAKFNER